MTIFLLGVLATWRLTSLLVSDANGSEPGPFGILDKLRDAVGVTYDEQSQSQGGNEVARTLTCVWCASVWIGGIVALIQGYRGRETILRALAYSAGAIMVNRWVNHAR